MIGMIEIKEGNKTIWFADQKDADGYTDYLQNGLKVIRKDGRTFYFNNGDTLIDISLPAEENKRYILHYRNGKKATCEKLQKRHIQAIAK